MVEDEDDVYLIRRRAEALTWGVGDSPDEWIGFLQSVGTSEELKARLQELLSFKAGLDSLARDPDNPYYDRIIVDEALDPLRGPLRDFFRVLINLIDKAEAAERNLASEGVVYDAESSLARELSGGPGAPRHLVRKAIQEAWKDIRPHYWAEENEGRYDTQALRNRIADVLQWEFPLELLDTSSGGIISQAINAIPSAEKKACSKWSEPGSDE